MGAIYTFPVIPEIKTPINQRYEHIFREDEYANQIMTEVTGKLIFELDLDISKQRLDSTHVFSDMATFARTRLMGVAIKRFMTQLKRHNRERYDALPENLRHRYKVSQGGLFGDVVRISLHLVFGHYAVR